MAQEYFGLATVATTDTLATYRGSDLLLDHTFGQYHSLGTLQGH